MELFSSLLRSFRLNHNLLNLIQADLIPRAVVELGGSGGFVGGDALGVL